MIKWLQLFIDDSLGHPENVVIVPSSALNPEDSYYYQPYQQLKKQWEEHLQFDSNESRKPINVKCYGQTRKQMKDKIKNFKPSNEAAQ